MQSGCFGSKAKLLLQPYQQGQEQVWNELLHVVKDYSTEGYVRRQMDACSPLNHTEPIVRVFLREPHRMKQVSDTLTSLQQLRFSCVLQPMA